jgi:hypothetical protein
MARPKKTSAVLETVEDARVAARKLLLVTIEREKFQGACEMAITGIRKQYEKPICDATEKEKDLHEQLRQFMLTQKPADGKKSIDLVYTTIGLRKSPASLKLLNKAWTWAAVLVKLREKFGAKYLRTKDPEVDKDLVKAHIAEEDLAEFGLKLDDDNEEFFCNLNREKLGEA